MKKNFIIYAPAITQKTGGAHSILENFLENLDKNLKIENNWTFIGNSEYEPICKKNQIKYIHLNLNLKWFQRILYDFVLFKKKFLNLKNEVIIISFQNTTPITRKQDITLTYIHQAIPFIKNFKTKINKNLKLFLIKNFYFYFIKIGLKKKSSFLIVQSNWLRTICHERLSISKSNILIHRPLPTDINIDFFNKNKNTNEKFFYPSIFQDYKNHFTLIKAFILLANEIPNEQFTLQLTIEDLKIQLPKNLTIEYLGQISRNETLNKINNAKAILFPSLIESYGMPIAEAIYLKTPVIASNLEYARELLGEFGMFFNPNDPIEIKNSIINFINNRNFQVPNVDSYPENHFQDWGIILKKFLYNINK